MQYNNLLSPRKIEETLQERKKQQKELSKEASPSATSSPPVLCVLVGCGSYNPMTSAHVSMFEAAKAHLESEGRSSGGAPHIVIGAFASPVSDHYKKADLAPFDQRLVVAKKCIEESPGDVSSWLALDDWEGSQPQYTRTYYVLKSIEDRVKTFYSSAPSEDPSSSSSFDISNIRVYFVCGGDLFETFYMPGVWDLTLLGNIFKSFYLCVAARVGSKHPQAVIMDFMEPLVDPKDPTILLDLRDYESKVDVFTLAPNETSSTKVRYLLREVLKGRQAGTTEKVDEDRLVADLRSMMPNGCVEYLLETVVYAPPLPPVSSSSSPL